MNPETPLELLLSQEVKQLSQRLRFAETLTKTLEATCESQKNALDKQICINTELSDQEKTANQEYRDQLALFEKQLAIAKSKSIELETALCQVNKFARSLKDNYVKILPMLSKFICSDYCATKSKPNTTDSRYQAPISGTSMQSQSSAKLARTDKPTKKAILSFYRNMKMKIRTSQNPVAPVAESGEALDTIHSFIRNLPKNSKVLDVGGGRGYRFSNESNYWVMDINTEGVDRYIHADICDQDLEVREQFDVIITKDTLEHLPRPWIATSNIFKLLKEGGVFICIAPFNWRFHPSPYDCYRYSHQGLKFLIEGDGGFGKSAACMMLVHESIQGFWKNRYDCWPFGDLKHYHAVNSLYIGIKKTGRKFSSKSVDSDFSILHE
ncbi:hypothetical protein OGCDGJMD_00260 [Cyanobium usitatum str. Tous]|uniref:class I SAM-dependent methyltransferase n=1 Tax=Cyanobium usitatum TaxID=2304190 RepID=UPI002AD50750|nr:methyltransferase domain-containing protein [Cyanobium usitatum]CAK6687629.1 hypothetical protein OGCDGJMD_00260 [Cyanobium usitatum str. Tous]